MLVLLLAIGVGGGFGVSLALGENPPGSGAPSPLAARSPSLPIDPEPSLLPDADAPPLAVDLPMHRVALGSEGFAISYPVPRDRTGDTITFTYVDRLHQREGLVRWLDLGSGFADVEIAVTGRSVDVPGMGWLLDRVTDGVEKG